jgi:hypothetical protein
MPTRSRIGSLCALMVVSAVSVPPASGADKPAKPVAQSTDWPRWRGPNAGGVSEARNLPVKWSKTENVLWSAELPGWGTSSPVVFGDRVFVTSQVTEGGKKTLLTLCYDRKTGKELWRHDFGFGVDQKVHAKSNLAVNTPAVTADAVYVAFGNADIGSPGRAHGGSCLINGETPLPDLGRHRGGECGVLLGVYLGHVRSFVAEQDLGGLQSEALADFGGERVPQLVRVPVRHAGLFASAANCRAIALGRK